MPARRRLRAALACLLVGAAVAAVVAPPAGSSFGGVWDARERGCYCHSAQPSALVGFNVSGLPGRYAPGQNYTITLSVTFTDVAAAQNESQGGFYLEATAGALSVPSAMEGLVQVQGLEASHTANGSRMRTWAVNWTAPDEPGLAVSFFIFVNTVNGNKSESLGTDHWTQKTVRVGLADQPEITGPPPPRPALALETVGVLVAAAAFGGYALYTFRSARKTAGAGSPDNRYRRGRRRGRGKV